MKNFSIIVALIFTLFIGLGTKTRGQKVCLVPQAVAKPCDPKDCNTQCSLHWVGIPSPGNITGPLLGANCFSGQCFCTFCCLFGCN
ncbi:hypothetical protein A4A49_15338 [Nicotiana attenuata]|uniref:Defensin-like protein n=1 Tax=Nicotiana attenuata TaxID=49451 RepID=A0A314KWF3_NICAT|nr:hypothetical protein A4A49_15338 [Nicotiana attenuata]